MKVQQLTRSFKYGAMQLDDPGAGMSTEQVKEFYATIYPELNNAEIEGPETVDDKLVYEFRKAVGTKGASAVLNMDVDVIEPAGRGVSLIAIERKRQIAEEGWDAQHDDAHLPGELATAAGTYALHTALQFANQSESTVPSCWPWHPSWWKPKDPVRNLVRAGALIAAEIDRRLREEERNAKAG